MKMNSRVPANNPQACERCADDRTGTAEVESGNQCLISHGVGLKVLCEEHIKEVEGTTRYNGERYAVTLVDPTEEAVRKAVRRNRYLRIVAGALIAIAAIVYISSGDDNANNYPSTSCDVEYDRAGAYSDC